MNTKKFLVVTYFNNFEIHRYFFFKTIKEVEDFKKSVEVSNSADKKNNIEVISTFKLEEI